MGLFSSLFKQPPKTTLLEAIKNKNVQEVRHLIKQGANVNQIINEPPLHANASLLHVALNLVGPEKLFILKMLVSRSDKLEHENALGYTPLGTALLDEEEEIIDVLLDAGANPLAISDKVAGASALTVGLRMENQDILTKVIKKCGAINFDTPVELGLLDAAVFNSSPLNVLLFLNRCPDHTKRYLLSKTRLAMAAENGRYDLVRGFLDIGIDIDLGVELVDKDGIDLATRVENKGHHKVAALLRERDSGRNNEPELSRQSGETINKASDATLFLDRLNDHCWRIENASPAHTYLLQQYLTDSMKETLAGMASEKMALTLEDQKVHSIAVSENGVGYCIYTIPVALSNSSKWFEEHYGGYSPLLNQLAVQPSFTTAEVAVLFHFIYGQASREDELWFNMTIIGLGDRQNEFQAILAVDLLSPSERIKYGFA